MPGNLLNDALFDDEDDDVLLGLYGNGSNSSNFTNVQYCVVNGTNVALPSGQNVSVCQNSTAFEFEMDDVAGYTVL